MLTTKAMFCLWFMLMTSSFISSSEQTWHHPWVLQRKVRSPLERSPRAASRRGRCRWPPHWSTRVIIRGSSWSLRSEESACPPCWVPRRLSSMTRASFPPGCHTRVGCLPGLTAAGGCFPFPSPTVLYCITDLHCLVCLIPSIVMFNHIASVQK